MTPQEMIDRYVFAVSKRLPHGMRADVGAELRALIADGVNERAGGAAADERVTSEFLLSLGSPARFALQYHAPAPIIEPIDARLFSKISWTIVIALAVLAASAVLAAPHANDAEWREIAAGAIVAFKSSALTILGALLVVFWALGIMRRDHHWLSSWKPSALPRAHDPDAVNRVGAVAALAAWILGFLIIMQPVAAFDLLWGGHAPDPVRAAFAYDETFSRERAPFLWLSVGASLVVYAFAAIEGRWRTLTRRVQLGVSIGVCAVSIWCVVAGDIFVAEPTDQSMKFGMALLAGFSLMAIWGQFRDEGERAPPFANMPTVRL